MRNKAVRPDPRDGLGRHKVAYWRKPRVLRITIYYSLLHVNRRRVQVGRSEKCLRASDGQLTFARSRGKAP